MGMTTSFVPRILVAGSASGVGKSIFVTGLLMALRRRGLSVSCCVTGEAIQQAVIYSRITHRYVRCLDRNVLGSDELLSTVGEAGRGADIVLIDGRGGLYDGRTPGNLSASDAEIAALTSTPVVLVVDTPKLSDSLSAMIQGFAGYSSDVTVSAVIANQVGRGLPPTLLSRASDHEALRHELHARGLPPCDGALPFFTMHGELPPAEALQQVNFTAVPLKLLNELEQIVASNIDLDDIVALASTAPPFEFYEPSPVVRHGECRIAVADDSCFNLCFQDNLDLLRLFGAELVKFSPLADSRLPKSIGGVYIPGACIAEYAENISANKELFAALRQFHEQGGVIYSEGAGTAMLCNSFKPDSAEEAYEGAGLIPLNVVEAHQERAIFQATIRQDAVLGDVGWSVAGLATGEWRIKTSDNFETSECIKTLDVELADGSRGLEGFSASAQSFSTLHFLHFGSNFAIPQALVQAAAAHQKSQKLAQSRGA